MFLFALYTGCRKIYLVGCDCNVGHSFTNNLSSYHTVIPHWIELKRLAEKEYPSVEILVVRPVGLKGIFEEAPLGKSCWPEGCYW